MAAGSLDDPTLRITSDEIDRLGGPRQNKMIYSVEQEIPLWGKRDLKRGCGGLIESSLVRFAFGCGPRCFDGLHLLPWAFNVRS